MLVPLLDFSVIGFLLILFSLNLLSQILLLLFEVLFLSLIDGKHISVFFRILQLLVEFLNLLVELSVTGKIPILLCYVGFLFQSPYLVVNQLDILFVGFTLAIIEHPISIIVGSFQTAVGLFQRIYFLLQILNFLLILGIMQFGKYAHYRSNGTYHTRNASQYVTAHHFTYRGGGIAQLPEQLHCSA